MIGDRPPLVGRQGELEALRRGLTEASSGWARLYQVVGEAGIGKTRLADAFSAEATTRGARVMWGRSWEAGGAPAYWPWIQVVRACLREAGAGVETELRDRLLPLTEPFDLVPRAGTADVDRFSLFDAVVALVRRAAAETPLVIILDDLHAADEASLLLLRYLVGELAETSVVVVAIHREPELEDDDPRTALLASLAREPIARRVEPSRLMGSEIEEMVRATVGRVPDSSVVRSIATRTEGNPLFVAEMSRLIAERDPSGTQTGLVIPPTVKQVIGRRLDRLEPGHRSALQLASVVGREFDEELIGDLDVPSDELLDSLGAAAVARIIYPGLRVGSWRFSHVLMRDVLYESLPLAMRKALHDRVGRAIERRHPHHHSRLAHHAMAALPGGDSARARRLSALAGTQSSATAAHEEAVRHYANALAALELEETLDELERCRLLIDLGAAQRRAGQPDARGTLLTAGEIAERLGQSEELARAAIAYGGTMIWLRAGEDVELIPFLERALLARSGQDDVLRVRLLGRLAGALRSERDGTRRNELSAEAVALARRLGDPTALVEALISRQMAIAGPDALDEMHRLTDEMTALVPATRNQELVADVVGWSRVSWLTSLGPPPEVMEHLVIRADDVVGPLRLGAKDWYMFPIRNAIALAQGRYEGLEEAIERAHHPGDPSMSWDAEVSYRLARYTLARERGGMEAVLPLLIEPGDQLSGYWLFEPARIQARASLGRPDARQLLAAYVREPLLGMPHDSQWLWAVVQLADAAALLADEESASLLLDLLLPYRALAATAAMEVIAGPVGRAVGALAGLLGRTEIAETAFREALAMCERTAWRPWEAWTRYDQATFLHVSGRPADAATAVEELRQARQIAAELGMSVLVERCAALEAKTPADRAAGFRASTSGSEAFMSREGEVWTITFEGRTTRAAASKGLRYLAELLGSPGRSIPAVDLVLMDAPGTYRKSVGGDFLSERTASGADPILDREARKAYRDRLVELQSEADDATARADIERATSARAEMEFLARELATAIGLGGRPRDHVSEAERARQSVTKAIKAAISRLRALHPSLGEHLIHAVRTGTLCAYVPDPRVPLRWTVRLAGEVPGRSRARVE